MTACRRSAWYRPAAPRGGPVVLHLHGGCYTMGSAEGAIDLASRLAEAVGGWALVPDYRLAPEYAYPAALDDVVAAYGWLVREYGAERSVVSGECAGGGLAVAMAVRLRDARAALPAALHVVSPFCDLTLTSAAANEMPGPDPWLNRDRLRFVVASYIHTADPATPLISPVNADLRGLPPLLIQAAEGEALRDDAKRLAAGRRGRRRAGHARARRGHGALVRAVRVSCPRRRLGARAVRGTRGRCLDQVIAAGGVSRCSVPTRTRNPQRMGATFSSPAQVWPE